MIVGHARRPSIRAQAKQYGTEDHCPALDIFDCKGTPDDYCGRDRSQDLVSHSRCSSRVRSATETACAFLLWEN